MLTSRCCVTAGSTEALSVSRQHQGRKLKALPEEAPLRIKLLASVAYYVPQELRRRLNQTVANHTAQVDALLPTAGDVSSTLGP